MTIVVFGSINMDLVARTPSLPIAGQTITGHNFFMAPGGKGANQAVSAARLGCVTAMVGRVGNDVFADALLDSLRENQVDVSGISVDDAVPSGVAVIAVDDNSENNIIVIPGANGEVGDLDVLRLEAYLEDADVLLLQLEVPLGAVIAAAQAAHEREVLVVLDPAPARQLPDELYSLCNVITPNEVEAGTLVDFSVNGIDDAKKAADKLLDRGVKNVIVKMGSTGAYWSDGAQGEFFPAHNVDPVDTVAAGDAFNGGLAVGLAEGLSIKQAIRWGMAAGALSTTKEGAQPSMPGRSEVEALLSGGVI
ncbi:MAG: ribokinase [Chloroflexota bacterium]|nr:ribokinase [Chloroflexota bacterium]